MPILSLFELGVRMFNANWLLKFFDPLTPEGRLNLQGLSHKVTSQYRQVPPILLWWNRIPVEPLFAVGMMLGMLLWVINQATWGPAPSLSSALPLIGFVFLALLLGVRVALVHPRVELARQFSLVEEHPGKARAAFRAVAVSETAKQYLDTVLARREVVLADLEAVISLAGPVFEAEACREFERQAEEEKQAIRYLQGQFQA